MSKLKSLAQPIRLLALDVDGVLTDGRLHYSPEGEKLKIFDCQDGLGIKLLHKGGIECVIITGRNSPMVSQRAQELGITAVIQGRDDKLAALQEFVAPLHLQPENIAYAGDDLPDLSAIQWCGLGIAVANAHALVKRHAQWQTERCGGHGAVREICEGLLELQEKLAAQLSTYHL